MNAFHQKIFDIGVEPVTKLNRPGAEPRLSGKLPVRRRR